MYTYTAINDPANPADSRSRAHGQETCRAGTRNPFDKAYGAVVSLSIEHDVGR